MIESIFYTYSRYLVSNLICILYYHQVPKSKLYIYCDTAKFNWSWIMQPNETNSTPMHGYICVNYICKSTEPVSLCISDMIAPHYPYITISRFQWLPACISIRAQVFVCIGIYAVQVCYTFCLTRLNVFHFHMLFSNTMKHALHDILLFWPSAHIPPTICNAIDHE